MKSTINWQPVESLCLSPKDNNDCGEYIAITAINELGRKHCFTIWAQKRETPFERPGVYYDHTCSKLISPRQIRKWLAVAPLGIEPDITDLKPCETIPV